MNDTHITICGNVTADPIARTTSKGEPMVKVRLASTPWRYDAEQRRYVDGTTSFVDVLAFRGLARGVMASVNKGDPLVVHGRMRVVSWERDGKSGTAVEVEASSVGHDLARGVSSFTRAGRTERASEPTGESHGFTSAPIDPADADTDAYVVRSA